MIKSNLLILSTLLILLNCIKIEPVLSPPDTVPYVNLTQYAKVWYQQAEFPFYWEHGCTNNIATYSLNTKGTIRVNNSCIRNGKQTTTLGQAIPLDSTNAKLKVQFKITLDIPGPYWIVRLAKDYTYAVVCTPNYQYLWILASVPNLPEETYNIIIQSLKEDQFPVEKLKRTPYK